jgi:ubiquinone biosynthesis protein COQ9
MIDSQFDTALVTAAFELGAEAGWRKVAAAAAARKAGLDLATARTRFGSCAAILRKFGELGDAAALTGALTEGPVRDRLFDVLMRRFDFLQVHRAGVLALLKVLPADPVLALCLARANLTSMGWMLEAAGIGSKGVRGELRKRGLLLVWVYGVRAWARDETADLTATMAAVDEALNKADSVAARFSANPLAETPKQPDLPFPEAPSEVE